MVELQVCPRVIFSETTSVEIAKSYLRKCCKTSIHLCATWVLKCNFFTHTSSISRRTLATQVKSTVKLFLRTLSWKEIKVEEVWKEQNYFQTKVGLLNIYIWSICSSICTIHKFFFYYCSRHLFLISPYIIRQICQKNMSLAATFETSVRNWQTLKPYLKSALKYFYIT